MPFPNFQTIDEFSNLSNMAGELSLVKLNYRLAQQLFDLIILELTILVAQKD